MSDYATEIELGIKDDKGFRMLADQKRELLQLIADGHASDLMNGLVHLIDHIQDKCVDECSIPEKIVFPNLTEN